jgi:hypothetical protein
LPSSLQAIHETVTLILVQPVLGAEILYVLKILHFNAGSKRKQQAQTEK